MAESSGHSLTDAPKFKCLRALLNTLRHAGARKADLIPPEPEEFDRSRVARANVRYVIRGVVISDPTPSQLRSMRTGDRALMRPGATKADHAGMSFGDKDIPLPFDRADPGNAAAALVDLELALPVHGQSRDSTPMFTDSDEMLAMSHATADDLFRLLAAAALGADEAATITLHGGRVWKAVALRAINCSIPTIQACCRWKTAESAEVYARLMPDEHARLITEAAKVDVTRTLTASLRGQCTLDADARIAALNAEISRLRLDHTDATRSPRPAHITAPITAVTPAPRDNRADDADCCDSDSTDDDGPEPVAAGERLAAPEVAPGATVAVPFLTNKGETHFAGVITKVTAKRARVRFPEVDGTVIYRDVDHNRLFRVAPTARLQHVR